ncbi:hypothetical protein KCU90_g644, partial [Aureobasidium melanogenum]
MALHRERIELFAPEFPLVAQTLGCFTLARQLVPLARHPAERLTMQIAIAAHRDAAHVFRAAGHHHLGRSECNQTRGDVHRFLAGAAFSVDREARDAVRPTRAEQRRARDIGGLLANLRDAAEDYVVDDFRREPHTFDQFIDHMRTQMIGTHARERAAKLADRRARRTHDHDVAAHSALPFRPEPGTR